MARQLKPCGTPAAYRRHLRHDEEPCEKCKRAAREEKRLQRAEMRVDESAVLVEELPDRPRLNELRWQAEVLRKAIEWASTNHLARLPGLMKERRDTLAEIAKLSEADDTEGGALGEFLSGPGSLSLVGSGPAEDRKQA